jgi:hypothetical protein
MSTNEELLLDNGISMSDISSPLNGFSLAV